MRRAAARARGNAAITGGDVAGAAVRAYTEALAPLIDAEAACGDLEPYACWKEQAEKDGQQHQQERPLPERERLLECAKILSNRALAFSKLAESNRIAAQPRLGSTCFSWCGPPRRARRRLGSRHATVDPLCRIPNADMAAPNPGTRRPSRMPSAPRVEHPDGLLRCGTAAARLRWLILRVRCGCGRRQGAVGVE